MLRYDLCEWNVQIKGMTTKWKKKNMIFCQHLTLRNLTYLSFKSNWNFSGHFHEHVIVPRGDNSTVELTVNQKCQLFGPREQIGRRMGKQWVFERGQKGEQSLSQHCGPCVVDQSGITPLWCNFNSRTGGSAMVNYALRLEWAVGRFVCSALYRCVCKCSFTYIVNGSHQEEDDPDNVEGEDGSKKNQHDGLAGEKKRKKTSQTTFPTNLLCRLKMTGRPTSIRKHTPKTHTNVQACPPTKRSTPLVCLQNRSHLWRIFIKTFTHTGRGLTASNYSNTHTLLKVCK